MSDLTPVFYLAGIAIGTAAVEQVMDRIGHGDKNMMIRVVGYIIAGGYAFRTWFQYLGRIASMFGVMI